MKKMILLILVGFISSCALTLRKGEYCHEILGGDGGPCVKFEEKHKFKWQTNGDLGTISVGSGTYKIKNNKLYLMFKKDSLNYESTVEILNKEVTDKDEVSLVIKVVDEQKMPSPNARITINGSKDKRYFSDTAGMIRIQNIPKSKNPIDIQVEPLDVLESYSFPFTPNKNAKLLVTLYKAKPKLITEKTFVYEIIDKDRKKLMLENSAGKTLEFKRVVK